MAMYEPAYLPPNAEEQDFIQAYENVREKYKEDVTRSRTFQCPPLCRNLSKSQNGRLFIGSDLTRLEGPHGTWSEVFEGGMWEETCRGHLLRAFPSASTPRAPHQLPVEYKRHLSTTSNSQTPNSTMAKTKELSKDTRNKIVDLHQAGKTESAIGSMLWAHQRSFLKCMEFFYSSKGKARRCLCCERAEVQLKGEKEDRLEWLRITRTMVAGTLMPLRDLRAIYEVLFRDGVMVAKKDKRPQIKHPEIEGVSNLQVIRAMGSLKSRGCVKETFAWRHFYWYLTNEGIGYLRDYLHLPPEIVPASLQRVRKPAATLAIAHRAARVQSVEGPTSYVPKPGRRGETESQEALAERQGYRHKMMGPGERESYSDRTPRFRGRQLAAGPVRPKASWEVEDQPQPLFRRGNRSEAVMMEESRIKRVSSSAA
ncbi:hypothetical protein L3Q82_002483 [Scortum barcoo]|uniref:Uncharacterized protein n=1 Tax=Scortum barcoo TaxID=214431 RepID=A0ACB8VYD1_9TELE|nr:hypothetical protein L3Q82_002483 [Scortum barcoo]